MKARQDRIERWVRKTANSPFAVDLLAEDERVAEVRDTCHITLSSMFASKEHVRALRGQEARLRAEEEERRRRALEARKAKAKNSIILRALEESSDLDALRREKRAILQEEKRLKALLATEKNIIQAKQDRIVRACLLVVCWNAYRSQLRSCLLCSWVAYLCTRPR